MRSLCVTSSKRMLQGCFTECVMHEIVGVMVVGLIGGRRQRSQKVFASASGGEPAADAATARSLGCAACALPHSLLFVPFLSSDLFLTVRRCHCEWSGSLEGRRAAVIAIAVRVAASPFIGPFGLRARSHSSRHSSAL